MAEEQNKYRDFDELVFENRNKEYGAYDLRKAYPGYLTRAFLIGTSIFLLAILSVFFISSSEGKKGEDKVVEVELLHHEEIEEEEEDEIFENKVEEQVQSIQDLAQKVDDNLPEQATVQNLELTVTDNPKKETGAADSKENKDINYGTENKEGAKTNFYQGDQRKDGVEGGQGNQSKQENTKVVDYKVDNTIHKEVDVEAKFPGGGLDGFRARVQENFDTEAVEGEGILTTTVTFVVEKDGTITQVKAKGNNSDFNREAERVIRSIRTRWSPAKKGGQNVRSYYTFPMKMRFE
ncbi:MAG: energy transducer TonB [Flavobacteriaceae bacterium]|nr:energy transducer TonB [Flavobacteriaceae bacterium]